MNEEEKLIELIAGDLVMVKPDDLPALAKLHTDFLQLVKAVGGESAVVSTVAQKCADYVEKIVLGDVDDRDAVLSALSEGVVGLQYIIRDNKDASEVWFPSILAPSDSGGESVPEHGKDYGRSSETEEAQSGGDAVAEHESLTINLDGSDTSLMADFVTEAREHCATAEQMLMDLETDEKNQAAIDAIFRSFHTIKGAAGFLDLKPISVLAHECETLLDLARSGTVIVKGKIADRIFDSIDAMRSLLVGVEEVLKEGGTFDGTDVVSSLVKRLQYLIANKDEAEEADVTDGAASQRLGEVLSDMGAVSRADVEEAIAKKESPEEKIGETLVKQGKVPAKAVVHALRDQQRARKDSVTTVKEVVKIDTERLDRLVDTIGELVIAESMVGQDEQILAMASTKIAKNLSHLNKITRELQEMGMAMRMVPVRAAFQKLARAVRDLARKSGKKINLNLSGEDTEVDRSIVENIGDPLMHMVRNSVDHGLEMPEERVKLGKPETGNVWIRAYHKGGNICFEIEDDGKGLDKEKILAKAAEKGLITGSKKLTDKEIYNLVLLPGFSTATKVTNISGRGVGMDVVKKNVDSMRGHLEIESEAGKGTKFSMKLPLTLAIIDGMLVSVAGEKYILPTLSVVESMRLTPAMISTVRGKGEMINLRGKMLPLFRIRSLFEYALSDDKSSDSTVVVIDDMERRVGLVVDRLLGQRQTVIKSLGPIFKEQKWISGGAILSDGNIGLIIDVSGIINLATSGAGQRIGVKPKSLDNILRPDDSEPEKEEDETAKELALSIDGESN